MPDAHDPGPLTPASLAAWREEVEASLSAVTCGFEEKHGYGPGENAIHPPEADDRVAAWRLAAQSPGFADPAGGSSEVGAAATSDVGKASFLHPGTKALQGR
ncbi:hypothetical protein ACFVFI_39590, partial [Streptomyces sp. NPDC057705]